jgi:hypothetical protein
MSIWIFAFLVIAALALAGWRQGAIRAAIAFVGIFIAALLAVPVGHLIHPLLPHLGASNPFTAWILSPVVGFIIATIPFHVGAHYLHHRIEHFYKYNAGDLRLALWERLNTRVGICIGVLNGAVYFVLISFFIFNISYVTAQTVNASSTPPLATRLVNSLGAGLQDTGFSKVACAVATLPSMDYQLADLAGLLMQNPQAGGRLANYPGLNGFWHSEVMVPLVTDAALTNAPAAGTSLGEILNLDSVKGLIANKSLCNTLVEMVETNLTDLTAYLKTGNSAKYDNEPILGHWGFNAGVTLAWFRQGEPKMPVNELQEVYTLWPKAYGQTKLLMTGDGQAIVTAFPKFQAVTGPNQPAFQPVDGKGDWSRDGTNYTVHLTFNGQDKYLSGYTDGIRLRLKDGHTILIFNHVN